MAADDEPSNQEEVVYQGRIIEVVQLPQPSGKIFEVARRAPGTRLIIPSKDGTRLLLTKDHRRELGDYDFRLPGGKVFDTLEEYDTFRASGKDILEPAEAKARAEALEETGLIVTKLHHIYTSICGTTVEWDLLYFLVGEWQEHPAGQAPEDDEDITVGWYSREEVKAMALDGRIREDRSVAIILRYLAGKLQ
jgi:ADP-ribose pyrophosphatase